MKNRKRTRLTKYNYSQPGAYFVTTCIKNREHLFGKIVDNKMVLNEYGMIVKMCWEDLPNHYEKISLDTFIIMPNHFHGIITVHDDVGTGLRPVPTEPTSKPYRIPEYIRAFKSYSSQRINLLRNSTGQPVWQRSYHDRIIRNEHELNRIREYIINNPTNWETDELNAPSKT